MSSVDVLKHSVTLDEELVFDLIKKPQEIVEVQPSNFVGRVAIWAEEVEQRYGDSVIPRTTYTENGPHRVSWVYHEGEDSVTGEPFCTHHIACDFIGGLEGNSTDSEVDYIVLCDALTFRDTETGDFEQPITYHWMALESIKALMKLDAEHPAEWPANLKNGEHSVSVMATMLQLNPEVVKWYGRNLEQEGIISDFDGETLRPIPDALAA